MEYDEVAGETPPSGSSSGTHMDTNAHTHGHIHIKQIIIINVSKSNTARWC